MTPRQRPGVVSLVPSVTETLLAWGIEPLGVTRFCPGSGAVRVGGTKNPDVPAIARLAPDLVFMDTQENRSEDAEALAALGVRVHATDVRSVADVETALDLLRAHLGLGERRSSGENRGPNAAGGPSGVPDPSAGRAAAEGSRGRRLRVWVPIWRRPWMAIGPGTYGSSLLQEAGLDNVVGASAGSYPSMSLEDALALGPDLVLAPSEPYPFKERHRSELERVAPVVLVDGQDLFWWGQRTPEALGRLRRLAADLAGR